MPPKVKYQKEEIVEAALRIAAASGVGAVTARGVAKELGVSVGPIFTYFSAMEELKRAVREKALLRYRSYIVKGLSEDLPFLGLWKQFIRFAKEERELFRLLFLSDNKDGDQGFFWLLDYSAELARPSVMRFYGMNETAAYGFFRDIWLVAFSFAVLTVNGDCPYTDEMIFRIGAEISLSVCKAYKEVPGLAEGIWDRDKVFGELLRKTSGNERAPKEGRDRKGTGS